MAAHSALHCCASLLLISAAVLLHTIIPASSLGINYGQIANNLPSPDDVVPLVKAVGATKLKLYDADPKVLKAFANTGVEFIVCISNDQLANMKDPNKAQAWVKTNVVPYLPATKISCITLGNEVLSYNDTTLTSNLLPAMQGIYTALVNLNLHRQVTVSTAHNFNILETSYPPSKGMFRRDLCECIYDILQFHQKTCSPFLINAYPYFAYKASPKQVPIDYVLFQPNAGVLDPVTKLRYDNMLFAQVDAVYSAMAALGVKNVSLRISETGWPSKGDADEAGANPENAKKYNGNLMKLITQKKGTPMKPDADLDIYVFALFNENMKPGPTSERNYGLFKPDGTPVYSLGISGIETVSNNGSSSSPNGGGSSSGGPAGSSSNGYLSITSNTGRIQLQSALLFLCLAGVIRLTTQF